MKLSSLELNKEPCILLFKTVHLQVLSKPHYAHSVLTTIFVINFTNTNDFTNIIILQVCNSLLYVLHIQVICDLSFFFFIFLNSKIKKNKTISPNLHIFLTNNQGHWLSIFSLRMSHEYLDEAGPETKEFLLVVWTLVSSACFRGYVVRTCFVEHQPNLLSDQFHHSELTKDSGPFIILLPLPPLP